MDSSRQKLLWAAVCAAILSTDLRAQLGTAFTYQGHLEKPAGVPVDDTCDFKFALFDAPTAGAQIGNSPQIVMGVVVTGGVFAAALDFDAGAINGNARWLAIEVQCSGDASFVMLEPRVELTPAPHALALPGLFTQENPTSPNIIGGLSENTVTSGVAGATIAGGGVTGSDINRVTDNFGTIGGGCTNVAGNDAGSTNDQPWATVGGGLNNRASGQFSSVSGGSDNRAGSAATTVGGGQNNQALDFYGTVSGGVNNSATLTSATVSGGNTNTAGGAYSTVSGGRNNVAGANDSTVSGGQQNSAGGENAAVVGGLNNSASARSSNVAGGSGNLASGQTSAIGGGEGNVASGLSSVVPGGLGNQSGGAYSLAAGRRGKVRNPAQALDPEGDKGTFVWADSTNADFTSTGPNQFLVRAGGGMGINTNAPTAALHIGGTPGVDGIRFPDGTLQLTATPSLPAHDHHSLEAADGSPKNAVYVDADGKVGIGTITPAEKVEVQGNLLVSGTMVSGNLSIDGGARTVTSDDAIGILAPGGLGIGTVNPGAMLDIVGVPGVDGIRFPDGTLQTTAAGPGSGDNYSLDAVDGDPVNALFVDVAGKVGIGTTAPAHQLDVVGDIHAAGAISTGSTIIIDGTTRTITSDEALLLSAETGVGIGTASPVADLDVVGSARVETLRIFGGSPLSQPLVGWGTNTWGQITVPTGSFVEVAAGAKHSIAIRTDGTLAGWGDNQFGQINVPVGVFKTIAAGSNFSVGVRFDGTLAAWGSNSSGQLNVPSGTFVAVAAGANHAVAIRADGSLAAWGSNTQGQTLVPSGTFTKISAGAFHNLAIRTNGTIAAWGDNTYGQSTVPQGTFSAIAAGFYFSLGIRTNGQLHGWGVNDTGQINVPAGTYVAVAAAGRLSFPTIQGYGVAIRSESTLVAWGDPSFGVLNVPSGTFASVAAGEQHALAISTDPNAEIALQLAADSAVKPGSDRWTIYSDRRLKKDIEPLSGALEQLLKLRGVTFHWRDPSAQGGIRGAQMGLIADEVQCAFPQWVGRDPKGYQTLNVAGFEALAAEAIRELREEKDRQLETKDCEIAELREKLERLERLIYERN